MVPNTFIRILVHYPYIVLIVVTLFSSTCLIVPLLYTTFPDFSDPTSGFETRGTSLSNRIVSWKNLLEASKANGGELSVNPKEVIYHRYFKPRKKKPKRSDVVYGTVVVKEPSNRTNHHGWAILQRIAKSSFTLNNVSPLFELTFFCGSPDENYSQVVITSDEGKDMFTLESLFRACHLERKLENVEYFTDLCIENSRRPKKCCRPWSLANYVALLNGRTSCFAITEEDVAWTKMLLEKCAKYYFNNELAPDCYERSYCDVPSDCSQNDAAYNILHYLVDTGFYRNSNTNNTALTQTMIILPMACSTAEIQYYDNLKSSDLSYEDVKVVAIEFGIKHTLFDRLLLKDAWLILLGGVLIVLCIWAYTRMLFLTIMTLIAIVFSLGVSYFVYSQLFRFTFFPFMNILAVVVVIGIGADDAFIFCNVWYGFREQHGSNYMKVMQKTLEHSAISMFVTSLTTAVAFFGSHFSSITALRCFGIFAGMAVVTNYILMITWLPASITTWEKYFKPYFTSLKTLLNIFTETHICNPKRKRSYAKVKSAYSTLASILQKPKKVVVHMVVQQKLFLFLVLNCIAITSAFIVFRYPKLQLPNSNEFQLFESRHLFEQYDLVYKNRFRFKHVDNTEEKYKLPLRFVWGVKPVDNGDYMNPLSLGTLVLDDSFNMSHPDSQEFLLEFCLDLRQQPFYHPTSGLMLSNCFIELFKMWMERRCQHPIDASVDYSPCCETSPFPYTSDVFDVCVPDAVADLYSSPSSIFQPGVAGPRFSRGDLPVIRAVVVEFDSSYHYSMSYKYMRSFLWEVEGWLKAKLASAPPTMKAGWFVSDVDFFDLQGVLSENTLYTVVTSMVLALIVLFATTLNILNSLYAIYTITCSIVSTTAILVLLGWKLNVLESIAITTTIGLTVDFSLHYIVNYKLSATENRLTATKLALENMLGPISMAALTTILAGGAMMTSTILAYKQIGQFMFVVMSVSWTFATFHLCGTLALIGPVKRFGQYSYSRIFCNEMAETPVENRLVISAITDSHEMETLNGLDSDAEQLHTMLSDLSPTNASVASITVDN